jgi:predicted nucleotidyltransferase
VDSDTAEARLGAFFEDDPRGAVAVYLFGSVARDEARPASDVDVGVLFASEPRATLDSPQFALEGDLETVLGGPVQVVALNRAPADLVHQARVSARTTRLRPGKTPLPITPVGLCRGIH